jgi:hypothetical protein
MNLPKETIGNKLIANPNVTSYTSALPTVAFTASCPLSVEGTRLKVGVCAGNRITLNLHKFNPKSSKEFKSDN